MCRDIRSLMPELVCLMLTSYADDEALYASVMAGAAGYVLKQIKARGADRGREEGGRRGVPHGSVGGGPCGRAHCQPSQGDPELEALSPQEGGILDLIAEGMTNRQIAEAMFLSEKTVKNYITCLLAKLKMTAALRRPSSPPAVKRNPKAPEPRPRGRVDCGAMPNPTRPDPFPSWPGRARGAPFRPAVARRPPAWSGCLRQRTAL